MQPQTKEDYLAETYMLPTPRELTPEEEFWRAVWDLVHAGLYTLQEAIDAVRAHDALVRELIERELQLD